MNPDDTVRESLYYYPSIYKTRGDVLHHLFCVIGNGYEWLNGELVTASRGDEDPIEREIDSTLAIIQKPNAREILQDMYWEILSDRIALVADRHKNLENAMDDYSFSDRFLYPKSETYAKLWNYPEDITPEWAVELEKAKNIFLPMYEGLSNEQV